MLNFLKTYKRVLALMGYVTVLMLSVACSPTSAPDPTGVESLASRAVLQRLTGAPLENFHFELTGRDGKKRSTGWLFMV